MNYMQEVGIVHRDLKSANVLLETVPINGKESMLRGEFFCFVFLFFCLSCFSEPSFSRLLSAVVCDFGLARVTNSATTLENMKFREIGGFSPRYAAPEVLVNAALMISSNAEIDQKSDVYSFAIIVWELLTRQIPWDGLTREQIEANVRTGVRVSFFFSLS